MSELINNREYRQNLLKGLIEELHAGGDFEGVKRKFKIYAMFMLQFLKGP